MRIDVNEMLQSYGLDSEYPEVWKDSPYTSALATLGSNAIDESNSGALVEELLSAITTSRAVANDEEDPLGFSGSIMQLLQQNAAQPPRSSAERAAFMPSSTSFDARRFLNDAHSHTSLNDLRRGLQHLKQKIAWNESGLRQMVDTDYENYVATKRKLDDVMEQLHQIGVRRETGFGFQELEQKIDAASNQLTVCARPMDRFSAEKQRLENALKSIESHHAVLELPQLLDKHSSNNDHVQFVREYKRGQRLLDKLNKSHNHEERRLGQLITARTQHIRLRYRDRLHNQLLHTSADGSYAPLLRRIMDLGPEGNPAIEWLNHNIERFSTEIEQIFADLSTVVHRNAADSVASARKLDLVTYLRFLYGTGSSPVEETFGSGSSGGSSGGNSGGNSGGVGGGVGSGGITAPIRNAAGTAAAGAAGAAGGGVTSITEASDRLEESEHVDTEEAIGQWEQLVLIFGSLQRVLHRATVFYHEFVQLTKHQSSAGSMSATEINVLTQQCHTFVQTTSTKLVECLSQPVLTSMSLPIASEHTHYSGATTGMGGAESAYCTFIPLNSNSLAVAKYLGRLLESLSAANDQIATIFRATGHTGSYPLSEAVVASKQQFVKALCECWTRDSMQLGHIQGWSSGHESSFPHFFLLYHNLMIERLRFLLDASRGGPSTPETVAYITRVFPAALSLSIKSVEEALVSSSQSLEAGGAAQQANVLKLQPAQLSQDSKLLVTLNNLETLRDTQLEQIYDQFETVIKQQTHTAAIRSEVAREVNKIASHLFDVYIRKKKARLSLVLHQEMQRLIPLWKEESLEVRRVSNYIYECLMVLVETHALFMESCPLLTRRAILELYSHLLTNVSEILRNEVDTLSRYGTLQNVADLEYMRWAMNHFPETADLCRRIFDDIKHASVADDVWRNTQGGARAFVMDVLDQSIKNSQFEFNCFKSMPS